jgi:hypothetical protein
MSVYKKIEGRGTGMSGTKSTGITVDQELVERCDRLRLAGPCKHYSLKRFREMILDMGINQYQRVILPVAKGGSPALAQLETRPRNGGKIIPFPGVSLETGGGIQDILDDFLREMGYVE